MEKEFVHYELAVKLKALGFDELCFTYYKNDQLSDILELVKNSEMENVNNEVDDYISAPTFSQCFRWFRDKKLADGSVSRHGEADGSYSYRWDIVYEYGVYEERHFQKGYKTYEEAELACLEKLIEIKENK